MTTNPDVLRLARMIAVSRFGFRPGGDLYKMYVSGRADDSDHVQIAIAAIERVTELAKADVVAMNQKHGNPCGTKYEEGANDMAFRIHGRLDSYRHLRQPEKGSTDE